VEKLESQEVLACLEEPENKVNQARMEHQDLKDPG